jgi:hypothetical protein
MMAKGKLPEPEGICPYCGNAIYIGFSKHVLICRLEHKK